MKKPLLILSFVLLATVSFYLGRQSVSVLEEVRYIKSKTIRDTVRVPKLSFIEVPVLYDLPMRLDSLGVSVVDTAQIIQDYIRKVHYNYNLFDNEYGKLDVRQTLQYNKLSKTAYSFTPISKEIIKQPLFIPYITSKWNTFGTIGVGGGIFYQRFGLEYQHLYNFNSKLSGHEIGLSIRL